MGEKSEKEAQEEREKLVKRAVAFLAVGLASVACLAVLFCMLRGRDGRSSCSTFAPDCVAGCVGSAIFVLYAAGLGALFLWLVHQTYRNEIDLLSAIKANHPGVGVSLSKLQIFLWTLVLVFAWLYQLALEPGKFPELPSQALVLLGLSGATYIGVKQIDAKREAAREEAKRASTGEEDREGDA